MKLFPALEFSQHRALHIGGASVDRTDQSISARQSRIACERLLAKVYEVDAHRRNRCGSPLKVLAVITHAQQCRRMLLHLIKTGAAPSGLAPPR